MTDAQPLPTNLTEQVAAFHHKFGYPDRRNALVHLCAVVPDAEIAHRFSIMVGEFLKVLEVFGVDMARNDFADRLRARVDKAHADGVLASSNLGNVAQVLADLDYTVESIRLMFGIPRVPVATEVHRANMEKVLPEYATPVKPPGWVSPKIVEILRREKMAIAELVEDPK